MSDTYMPRIEVQHRVQQAVERQSDFWVRYSTTFGPVEEMGRAMRSVLTADKRGPATEVAYQIWEGHWVDSALLRVSRIEAIITEDDWCPKCDDRIVNLDTAGEWDLPLCDVCAREAWEWARAEAIVDGRGL